MKIEVWGAEKQGHTVSQMALLSEGQQEGVGTDGQAQGHISYQGGAIIYAALVYQK